MTSCIILSIFFLGTYFGLVLEFFSLFIMLLTAYIFTDYLIFEDFQCIQPLLYPIYQIFILMIFNLIFYLYVYA